MDIQQELKKILVEELNLEDLDPESLEGSTPLFGDGLGLDSLDAVEIVVLIKKHYGVEIKDMEEGREALQSIDSLATFIRERLNS